MLRPTIASITTTTFEKNHSKTTNDNSEFDTYWEKKTHLRIKVKKFRVSSVKLCPRLPLPPLWRLLNLCTLPISFWFLTTKSSQLLDPHEYDQDHAPPPRPRGLSARPPPSPPSSSKKENEKNYSQREISAHQNFLPLHCLLSLLPPWLCLLLPSLPHLHHLLLHLLHPPLLPPLLMFDRHSPVLSPHSSTLSWTNWNVDDLPPSPQNE